LLSGSLASVAALLASSAGPIFILIKPQKQGSKTRIKIAINKQYIVGLSFLDYYALL